jgi:hypothetical protein
MAKHYITPYFVPSASLQDHVSARVSYDSELERQDSILVSPAIE